MRAHALLVAVSASSIGTAQRPVDACLDRDQERLDALYLVLKRNPELSSRGFETAARAAATSTPIRAVRARTGRAPRRPSAHAVPLGFPIGGGR